MRFTSQWFAVLVTILALLIFVKVKPFFDIPDKPEIEEIWWKINRTEIEDVRIRPFKIYIPDSILEDLKNRLNTIVPLHESLNSTKQHYGINDNLLRTIIDYWKYKYNWRNRENFLNQYSQFKTNIQGIDIQYIHLKPKQTLQKLKVLPLLMLHGWPSSIREFYEVIPHLTSRKNGKMFVFELIIPSLPGYGFSEGAEIPGLSTPQMAVIFKNLMTRLGFEKYYVHGSDWGGFIVSQMAALFPEKILGMHSTICWLNTPWAYFKLARYSWFPFMVVDEQYQDLVYPLTKRFEFVIKESGYLHIQGTKPDTIGVALRDSPIGLAAYILEKFSTWTNPSWLDLEDGGLTKKFKIEDLLDNVMIYWVTGCITTTMRLYTEYFKQIILSLKIDSLPITAPTVCSRFKHDLVWFPESILLDRYENLVHLSTYEDGGHFPAFEMPQSLAGDIMKLAEILED